MTSETKSLSLATNLSRIRSEFIDKRYNQIEIKDIFETISNIPILRDVNAELFVEAYELLNKFRETENLSLSDVQRAISKIDPSIEVQSTVLRYIFLLEISIYPNEEDRPLNKVYYENSSKKNESDDEGSSKRSSKKNYKKERSESSSEDLFFSEES